MNATDKDIKRFWNKVIIGESDDCWEWIGVHKSGGYGCFKLNRKMEAAHRVSYFLAHGILPDMDICHTCDNTRCVNPMHLFPGTVSQNLKQAYDHGRAHAKRGEANSGHKLTDELVREIRRLKGKMTYGNIANTLGISKRSVLHVVRGESWTHVI